MSEVNFCKKVLDWLTQEGNLALLASTSKPTEKNTLPKITYNPKKQEVSMNKEIFFHLRKNSLTKNLLGIRRKPKLYVPELSLYRVKKGIQVSVPDTFEIRLMLSPSHFYGNDEKTVLNIF